MHGHCYHTLCIGVPALLALDRLGSVADQPFYRLHAIFLATAFSLERDNHGFFILKTYIMYQVRRTRLNSIDRKYWGTSYVPT